MLQVYSLAHDVGIWWEMIGDAPILTKVNGLNPNQPCSASSREWNWSAFEAAQTKKNK